jgi:uncharacterized membrane protein (UPF0127 family)
MSQADKPIIETSIETSAEKPIYSKFIWLGYLLFPFMMQGFKTDEIAPNTRTYLPVEAQLIVEAKAIDLEVSRTQRTSDIGLGFREDKDMPNDRGLLHGGLEINNQTVFNGKNNKFATDLIFIQNNTVAYIDRVEPCNEDKCISHQTNKPFNRVVEVKAGIANKLNIAIGTKLDIRFYPRR